MPDCPSYCPHWSEVLRYDSHVWIFQTSGTDWENQVVACACGIECHLTVEEQQFMWSRSLDWI